MELRIMSIINKDELKEKAKEVAINIGSDLKSTNKTSKVVIAILLVLFLSTAAMAYKMYNYNVQLEALKTENTLIKNRMKDLDREVEKNRMEYLEILNRVDKIKSNLETKLKEAKEVVIHEVQTSHDIVSVLDELSDLTTGR